METGFELLEEKVRKAAELVRRLRKENKGLEDDLGKAKARLQDAEKKLLGLEKEIQARGAGAEEAETLRAEVKGLRKEREDVRGRIAKLVEILDSLE